MGSQVGMIVACDLNGLIGYDGKIPWESKEDMRRFKELTMGSTVIVGCKTYESLPGKKLPGRIKHVLDDNILSNDRKETADTIWFRDLKDALLTADENENIWIIGGAQLYNECLLFRVPDFIDLTILNFMYFAPLADRFEDRRKKERKLDPIPLTYMVESECQNQNDSTLFHRKYIRRPRWKSFIEDIREEAKEKRQRRKINDSNKG